MPTFFVVMYYPYSFEDPVTDAWPEPVHVATSMEAAKAWVEDPDNKIIDADVYPYWEWTADNSLVMGDDKDDTSTYVEIYQVNS